MREWMAVIDAVIQGAPEDARRRKETVNTVFSIKYKDKVRDELFLMKRLCLLVLKIS